LTPDGSLLSRRPIWNGLAAAAAAAISLLLALWPPFSLVEARVLDVFSTVSPPVLADLDGSDGGIVIVAIDEPSFAAVGAQWPWPRSQHAALIEALREAGARAIGVDMVFAEPSSPEEDAALAAAMGPDVVLAADETRIETPQAHQIIRTEPLPELVAAGARSGLASVVLDPDGVLRRLPPWPDSFAAVLRAAADRAPVADTTPDGFLQVFGPARTFPTVSYYQALEPAAYLPDGFFRDKIVLVGLSLQTAVAADASGADAFATAMTVRSDHLTAGVEVQATFLDNLRHGLFIEAAPRAAQLISIVAAAALAGLLAWRPVDHRTFVLAAALLLAVGVSSFALVQWGRVFLPPVAPALAVLLTLAPIAARDQTEERRMRREITRAFSHYLAPAMVERLARDPASLKLGGERRVLSILFCDVRNFTPMAERMKGEPEALTLLVNRILTPLSEAVLAHGGTIDKYIGDCVMAFWNAPLNDPEHAVHAVAAGLAMLESVERLNLELAGEGLGQLAVGVGVNTGACVVGNMGSARRFDYSALGDAVNYASRLEGASKSCGVPLLMSAATAAAVRDSFDPVLVDHIAVKGRTGLEPVYTVLSKARLPAEDLHRHQSLIEDLIEGRRTASDPEIAALALTQPGLGRILRTFATRAPHVEAAPD
jgi:adenylate cyclase